MNSFNIWIIIWNLINFPTLLYFIETMWLTDRKAVSIILTITKIFAISPGYNASGKVSILVLLFEKMWIICWIGFYSIYGWQSHQYCCYYSNSPTIIPTEKIFKCLYIYLFSFFPVFSMILLMLRWSAWSNFLQMSDAVDKKLDYIRYKPYTVGRKVLIYVISCNLYLFSVLLSIKIKLTLRKYLEYNTYFYILNTNVLIGVFIMYINCKYVNLNKELQIISGDAANLNIRDVGKRFRLMYSVVEQFNSLFGWHIQYLVFLFIVSALSFFNWILFGSTKTIPELLVYIFGMIYLLVSTI